MSNPQTSDPLRYQQHGAVVLLTLNRPDTRNALSGEVMFAAFESAFARLDADPSVRAAGPDRAPDGAT